MYGSSAYMWSKSSCVCCPTRLFIFSRPCSVQWDLASLADSLKKEITMQNEVTQTVEQAAQPFLETTKRSTDAVLSSFERAVNQIAELGPKLVGTIIVMVIGYVVARLM